jgi:hypothetical protein
LLKLNNNERKFSSRLNETKRKKLQLSHRDETKHLPAAEERKLVLRITRVDTQKAKRTLFRQVQLYIFCYNLKNSTFVLITVF